MGKTFSTGLLTNGIWQDSSNNIGIGAANSSYKFQVTGTTNLTGALSGTSATFSDILAESKTADGIIQTIGGNSTKANIYQFTSGGLAGAVFNIGHNFYYDGTNYGQGNAAKSGWVISSNLNSDTFSIGRAAAGSTSAPTTILSFASTGAATFSSSVIATNDTTGAAVKLTGFTNYGTIQDANDVRRIWFENTGSYRTLFDLPASGTAFQFRNNSGTILTTITSGGLGINTSTPSSTRADKVLSLYGAYPGISLESTGVARKWDITANYASGTAFLEFYDETAAATRMVINASGNVGIGTSSPGSIKLYVSQDTAQGVSTPALRVSYIGAGNGNPQNVAMFTNDATLATSAYLYIGSYSGSDWYVGKNVSGTSSSYRLEFGTATNNILGYLTTGGVWSTTGGGTSDERTKKDIQPILNNAITFINELKPVSFIFKDDASQKTRRGFIAQEVLKTTIPDLVLGDGDEEGGTYGLDYDGILALAVKAIQELSAKVTALENK